MKSLVLAVLLLGALHCAQGKRPRPLSPSEMKESINQILEGCVQQSPIQFGVNSIGVRVPLPSNVKFPFSSMSFDTMRMLTRRLAATLRNTDFQRLRAPTTPLPPVQMCPNPRPDRPMESIDFAEEFVNRYNAEGLNETVAIILTTDLQASITRTFTTLACGVTYNWVNAGETYFPPWMVSGYCRGRRCSVPDNENFICRPDVDPATMGSLTAFRYDCCWRVIDNQSDYSCGWVQVEIPVICDCDCQCGPRENLDLLQAQNDFEANPVLL